MIRPLILVLPVAFTAPLFAQKVAMQQKASDQPLRYSITSKFQTTDSRKVLVNGEEPTGGGVGGFGGAGGESTLSQEIVFDEGPANAWREYKKLAAKEIRPGQDGQGRESAVEGALQGKKVGLQVAKDGSVKLTEGEGDKAQDVNAAIARGIPGAVSLAGFLPSDAIAVGEQFHLGKDFAAAMRGLVHPVTPDRSQAGGGQAGGRGQGGQGGGRGGQGGARGPGGRGGASNVVLDLLGGGKLTVEGDGKLLGVEKKDGQEIATIEVKAKMSGKGKAGDLGLPAGFGGRPGQGGGQAAGGQAPAAPGTDNVDAVFEVQGKVLFDLTAQRVAGVEFDGNVTIARETKRTMERNGEETKMETTSNTKGKFQLHALCEVAAKQGK